MGSIFFAIGNDARMANEPRRQLSSYADILPPVSYWVFLKKVWKEAAL
jgi:hypothetical protein